MEQLTLTLKSEIQPAVMTFNFQEIQTILDARLDLYRNLVVTEDSLQGSKNAKKELVSFRNGLDEFRKEKKAEALKPINEFDNQIHALIEKVEEVEKPLDASLDVYAEKERQRKRDLAEQCFAEETKKLGLRPEYASQFELKKGYTNVTTSLKSIREDVKAQAEALKLRQDAHDQNISLVKETVEAENGRLKVKLDPAEFLDEFERTDDVLGTIRKIKKRAENIFQQEKKLEEERLERERREKERLERERAEKERQEREREERERRAAEEAAAKAEAEAAKQDPPGAMVIPPELLDTATDSAVNEEKASEVPLTSTPDASTIPTSVPGTAYSTVSPDMAMPFEKTEPVYEVTFRVTGGFGVLRELNTFLKNNNISYEVLKQIKK